MATNIFSVIEGLTVDKEDILEAELFAEQYLSAQFPTYDFRQGTALRDMTVRPNATLLALINKAIQHYFNDTDIINITNATDTGIVDSKLSNFFITRNEGNSSIVRARLYFSFPTVTPISTIVPSSASFSVDNEILFFPQAPVSINPDPGPSLREEGRTYFLYDNSLNLHYADIDLKAQNPSEDANIEEGDLLYFTIFSPYFISGEILYLIASAVETETNEEMVNRAYSSVSTRNLINSPSIISRITDQFNYVNAVYPVGLGNTDLYRDIITVEKLDSEGAPQIVDYHRGGHVDIYTDTAFTTNTVQLALDGESKVQITGPILRIRRSSESESGKPVDSISFDDDYEYNTINVSTAVDGVPDVPEDDVGLSMNQITELRMPLSSPGGTATFDILTYSGLTSISSAVNSEEQRVVCADYLIRAFDPVFLDIDVSIRTSVDTIAPIKAIEDYINSIQNGGTFYMSELISVIQDSGVENFVMPVSVTAVIEDRYRVYDSSTGVIQDSTEEAVIDSISLRTTQMFKPGNISLIEV